MLRTVFFLVLVGFCFFIGAADSSAQLKPLSEELPFGGYIGVETHPDIAIKTTCDEESTFYRSFIGGCAPDYITGIDRIGYEVYETSNSGDNTYVVYFCPTGWTWLQFLVIEADEGILFWGDGSESLVATNVWDTDCFWTGITTSSCILRVYAKMNPFFEDEPWTNMRSIFLSECPEPNRDCDDVAGTWVIDSSDNYIDGKTFRVSSTGRITSFEMRMPYNVSTSCWSSYESYDASISSISGDSSCGFEASYSQVISDMGSYGEVYREYKITGHFVSDRKIMGSWEIKRVADLSNSCENSGQGTWSATKR